MYRWSRIETTQSTDLTWSRIEANIGIPGCEKEIIAFSIPLQWDRRVYSNGSCRSVLKVDQDSKPPDRIRATCRFPISFFDLRKLKGSYGSMVTCFVYSDHGGDASGNIQIESFAKRKDGSIMPGVHGTGWTPCQPLR